MLRTFLQFLLKTNAAKEIRPGNLAPPASRPPESSPTDDRTRPSYRVGKHKPEDIHKALDMGG